MLLLSSPPPQVFSKNLPERHCLSRTVHLMCLSVTNEQKSVNTPTSKTSLNYLKMKAIKDLQIRQGGRNWKHDPPSCAVQPQDAGSGGAGRGKPEQHEASPMDEPGAPSASSGEPGQGTNEPSGPGQRPSPSRCRSGRE